MIEEDSVPEISAEFMYGLSVIYRSQNEITIFIEDETQSNLYKRILNNLFPEKNIERVFPLLGKLKVIEYAESNIGKRDEIYILDKDFDDILDKKKLTENIVYLDRYSIENYFLDERSIVEIVHEEKPHLDKSQIIRNLEFQKIIEEILNISKPVVELHLLVLMEELEIKCISHSIFKFVNQTNPLSLKSNTLEDYKGEIETSLKNKDGRFTLKSRLDQVKKVDYLSDFTKKEKNIPGKYLLSLLKIKLVQKFKIRGINQSSLMFRIAGISDLESFNSLKENIKRLIP